LQSIEQRVLQAKQQSTVARSSLYPLVFFNATDNLQYLSKNGLYRALNPNLDLGANLIDLSISFFYEFDFWSKNRNILRAAIGREKAEEASHAQVKLIVTTAIAQAYFALMTNLTKADLVQKLYEARRSIYTLQESLLSSGLYSKIPVLLAEETMLESEKLIEVIQDEIASNKHTINALVGFGPDHPIEVDRNFNSIPKKLSIPENLSIGLLSRRPDLMAQIWRVEALANEVGAARADFFPNINLNSLLGLETLTASKLFNSSSKMAMLEPTFQLPLYTADSIQANVDSKRAAFDTALFEYNDLILKSSQEVADLLSLAKSIYARKDMQTSIVESAALRQELIQLRQQNGLDNELQNLSFIEQLLQKKLDNIDLIYGQYLAAVKLIKALGGGYSSDFVPISKGTNAP
jgi:NodT family efflux transporter outer membrane factor (OMF) lipoprotein